MKIKKITKTKPVKKLFQARINKTLYKEVVAAKKKDNLKWGELTSALLTEYLKNRKSWTNNARSKQY
jgi:hypothetical protein